MVRVLAVVYRQQDFLVGDQGDTRPTWPCLSRYGQGDWSEWALLQDGVSACVGLFRKGRRCRNPTRWESEDRASGRNALIFATRGFI